MGRQGLELVTRYLRPGCCRGSNRISQVPGESQLSVCTCSKPTPAGLLAPDHDGAAAWPLVAPKQRLPRLCLSTLNSMAFGFAVYASQGRSPDTTQDSLPVAGQALLDGLSTRKIPTKGFRVANTSHSPFPSFAWRKVLNTRWIRRRLSAVGSSTAAANGRTEMGSVVAGCRQFTSVRFLPRTIADVVKLGRSGLRRRSQKSEQLRAA